MNETHEDSKKGATQTNAALEKDIENLSKVDRIFIRLNVLNTVLAVAGVFTGAVALYAAISESDAVRQQTSASVWPFVQFQVSNSHDQENVQFDVELQNAGVGPAKIVSIRVKINGEVQKTWDDVVSFLVPEKEISFGQNFARDRVLRPGEAVTMFQSQDTDLYTPFLEAANNPSTSFTYCYCSIFDDCWLADSDKDIQNPEPVDKCPDFGDEAFQN